MVGNKQRRLWQFWHSRQRGIRNLHSVKAVGAFESHPHFDGPEVHPPLPIPAVAHRRLR